MSRSQAPGPCYSERLDEALRFAAERFRFRVRKGSGVPYVTHLLQVCSTVGEHGGDEEQMIAALLHDFLEDIPGATEAELVSLFGERVARLVAALSDSVGGVKLPWVERKERFIAGVRGEDADVKLICAADKLHNAVTITRDQKLTGGLIFERFTGSKAQTLWYYNAVHDALSVRFEHGILLELNDAVDEMHALAGLTRGAPSDTAPNE